jgi:hypothetical protein
MSTGEGIGIKGRVYNRLIKSATNLLDLQAVDIRVLDPIVALFLGACADEFELLYQELGTYQSRILERLSGLLLPDVSKSPKPAHAVACARPLRDQIDLVDLAPDSQFYFRKVNPGAVSSLNNEVDVFFTPACPVNLVDFDLKYTLVSGKLYRIHDTFFRDAIAEAYFPTGFSTTCWLGLVPGRQVKSLSELRLFFDWPTIEKNLNLSGIVGNASFSLHQFPITVSRGLKPFTSDSSSRQSDSVFEPVFDPVEHIPEFYKSRFVTLDSLESGFPLDSFFQPLPEEFRNDPQLQGKTGKENLIWIKVVFDPSTPPEYLQELVVIPNAFPVVNRRKIDFTYRIQNNLNLVPIEPDSGFFMEMDSLVSGSGSFYTSSRSSIGEKKEGTYILRRGGVTRFDGRDARTLLNHLIDLLRQENASYKMMGYEVVSELLFRMEQLINSIEQKVNREQLVRDESTFLFLNPFTPQDNLFVSYWVTNGAFGNQIRTGTQMQAYSGSMLADNSIVLCTNTVGGSDPLSSSESLDAFKNALLTRDRIVSRSDIRHFCKAHLGSLFADIELKEVYRPSRDRNQAFEKVMLVEIRLRGQPEMDPSVLAHSLKTRLELASHAFQRFDVQLLVP